MFRGALGSATCGQVATHERIVPSAASITMKVSAPSVLSAFQTIRCTYIAGSSPSAGVCALGGSVGTGVRVAVAVAV